MRADEIRKHLRRQPFRPFRLFLSNGQSYDIPHPELMMVSRTDVVIAYDLGEEDMPEQLAYCDPVHITNIEPLDDGRKPGRRAKRK